MTTKVKLPDYKRVAVVWMEKYQELYWQMSQGTNRQREASL